MAGAGIVILVLRPWLPVVLSFHVANTCLMGSLLFWSQSLRTTLGVPWSNARVVLAILLCAVFYSVIYELVSAIARIKGMQLMLGGLSLYTAYWAWRLSKRMRSGNAATIAINYGILATVLIGQSILNAGAWLTLFPLRQDWVTSLAALTILITAMISHYCYVGMMLDWAANEQLEAQIAQQAAGQTRLLEADLQHMDRRRRMAILSGSLAHELNQPLTAALMNAQLAQRHWNIHAKDTPEFQEMLAQVDDGIERTVQILQRIRSGHDEAWPELHAVDLNRVIDQSLVQVEPDVRRLGVVLTQERSGAPLLCLGEEVALSQVLVNLLRNAIEAMAAMPQRKLMVASGVVNGRAEVRVRDRGHGLSDALLEHWGEPLLSTKPEGLGMGLAISREIVARHKGDLQLHNHPQGGVEATLSLPLWREAS